MLIRILLLLVCLYPITGCEKVKSLAGVPADPKELDAQAIGYACRVSKKPPEACMKENDTQSPTHILNGWKNADKDIKERVIDVGMSNEGAAASAVSSGLPVEGKKSESK